jgi:hypothetical protein
MRFLACMYLFVFSVAALAQSDRGTITGTVADPAKAMVPGAKIVVKNIETAAQYETVTTDTGNYTIPSLPAGVYEVSVAASGFNTYVQRGVRVQVAQTSRLDVVLQIGSTSESVTVNADAALLKTESADQSTVVSRDNLNALPLNFGGGGGSMGAIRSPTSFVVLTPGTSNVYTLTTGGTGASVNGIPGNSFQVRVEGQDATSANTPDVLGYAQPSVDAVEEFSLQTSNFAAEFGRVGGGLFNFTARSGTNQFHGSLYEYWVNDILDASRPFVNFKPSERKNNFGGTVGGPVWIPKIYNGRDKTFFFFSYEMFRNFVTGAGGTTPTGVVTGTYATLPTELMRNGNFSQILTERQLSTDSLGRPILENTIYDPASARTINGQVITDPFQGNLIPTNRFDPVAVKIQALIPAPTNSAVINNWRQNARNRRLQSIPALKIDHSLTSMTKFAFYYSQERTDLWANQDGLPIPITAFRDQHEMGYTTRLNYDQTLSPRLLLHVGGGYFRLNMPDHSPEASLAFDAQKSLGFSGMPNGGLGFPGVSGLSSAFGGMSLSMGWSGTQYYDQNWTASSSVTYIRGSHTIKGGAEHAVGVWINQLLRIPSLSFNTAQTGLPYLQTTSVGGGSVGFGYASFLLGMVNSSSVTARPQPEFRSPSWGLYLQDTWKITRRITFDYGLRWDYQQQGHELHYRNSAFSPTTPNPSAGGLPGALIYEGYGQGRCNCVFTNAYPYAIGPRLGLAYQINLKTVLRAGWGLVYSKLTGWNWSSGGVSQGVGWNTISFTTPSYGAAALLLRNGYQYNPADLTKVTLDPGFVPSTGQLNGPSFFPDPNGGRPGRINQWSIGLQHEIVRNLVVEANYVGNRGAWLTAGAMVSLNATPLNLYPALGLDIAKSADRSLLTSTIGSAAAQSRGFKLPYSTYPASATVAQSLRPFPQFSSGLSPTWAPLGNSWYDSLQMKATKRMSHGLVLGSAFTWAKSLASPPGALGGTANSTDLTGVNNVFNRANQKAISYFSQPFVFVVNFSYQIPTLRSGRLFNTLLGDWTVSGLLQYQSGLPIMAPSSRNNLSQVLFQNTYMNRVAGQPLYLKDLNCGTGCIDPNKDFVLNPAAWSDAAAGTWGTGSLFYNDYRYARRPNEQLSLGKIFRIRERMSLQVRAEFFNVFNRTYLANPDTSNPLLTQTRNAQGVPTAGFGRIDATSIAVPPRSGQLVARFQF